MSECEDIEVWECDENSNSIPVAVRVPEDIYEAAEREAAAGPETIRDHLFDKIAIQHYFIVDR